MPRPGESMWYHHGRCLHARKGICKCPWCHGRGHGRLAHVIIHEIEYQLNAWREKQVREIKAYMKRSRRAA